MGADVRGLLHSAGVAESSDDGLWLGIAIGELALARRDKLTFLVDPPVQSFGLWVEQLVAESTGKQGTGIVPVVDEPPGDAREYGPDRTFVCLGGRAADALGRAGHPVIVREIRAPEDLGRMFFVSELAVATAGWVLGINPFDQPDVQEAKDNTARVLAYGTPDQPDATDEDLRALLAGLAPPSYFALLAFVAPSEEFDTAAAKLRAAVRDATGAATAFGYGPRYLHSTGQLHKGGPPTGRFLQVVHDSEPDIDIPGESYGFTRLKHAQAIGDLETLRGHGLPAERITLDGDDAAAALQAFTERLRRVL